MAIHSRGEPFHGRICSWCARTFDWEAEEAQLWATSAWFDVCSVCRLFLSGTDWDDALCLEGVVKSVLWEEDCDCGGKIRHNTGGNYHWQQLTVANVVGLPG